MSTITYGLGGSGDSLITGGFVSRIKKIIEKIKKGIVKILKEIRYYDAVFKVPVEKLSIAEEQSKVIDISQLVFEKEIMSWDDLEKFTKH